MWALDGALQVEPEVGSEDVWHEPLSLDGAAAVARALGERVADRAGPSRSSSSTSRARAPDTSSRRWWASPVAGRRGRATSPPPSATSSAPRPPGAAALLAATVAALVWANSPWSDSYESVWTTELSIRVGSSGVSHDLRQWINEGLMTFYFLVVGLEAKRELDLGQLRERRRITLVVGAALGGMTVPILIFLAFNAGGAGAKGWGVAMSTDTAFALGALGLLAARATRLRVRLLTWAVVDDFVALIVIATAYTEHIEAVPLAVAAGLFVTLFALRFAPPEWRLRVAAVVGVAVWVALLKSGIDPVIAGLAVGLITGAYPPARVDLERVTEQARSFREQPTPALARSAQLAVASAISPNDRLQHRLHPWTSLVIVPLFALANAGIHIDGSLLSDAMRSPITWGIVVGYVIGKPLGIVGGTWIAYRALGRRIKLTLSWPVITGGGAVAGIGFTVALLIANIAFEGRRAGGGEARHPGARPCSPRWSHGRPSA